VIPAGDPGSRFDRAVIMARGLGSRMGSPKGLLRFSAGGQAFVRIIADLYLDLGFPVDAVVPDQYHPEHEQELPSGGDIRVISGGRGGDTALTLLMFWRSCRSEQTACSHIWAHPVDMPLATSETLVLLAENSRRYPHRIVRPVRQGIPGHPVILPYDVLSELDRRPTFQLGPLRDFLRQGIAERWLTPPVEVEVDDPGVVRDFDRPSDFRENDFPPEKDDINE
jgi:CTP:molybdopterin cytidylyltransferase MocA